MSGDGSIISKVLSLGDTNPWAKAGVMIRETVDSGSSEVALVVSQQAGIAHQWRKEQGDNTGWIGTSGSAPSWIKLERSGNSFISYKSSDGENWSLISSIDISMGSETLIGLCVTSHDDNKINMAQFNNVKLDGDVDKWVEGPGSGGGSTPLAYLHQRFGNDDISGYHS